MENLLDVEKAGETLGLSPWTIRAYIRDQKLTPVRLGRRVLLEPAELRRFVEEMKRGSGDVASPDDSAS